MSISPNFYKVRKRSCAFRLDRAVLDPLVFHAKVHGLFFVVGFYAVGMLAVGWYYSRRTTTTEDYLLGGRKMNPLSVGLSLFVFFEIVFQVGHVPSVSLHVSHAAGVRARSQRDLQTGITFDQHRLDGSAVRSDKGSRPAEQCIVAGKNEHGHDPIAQ